MDKKSRTIKAYSIMADDLALGYDEYFNQIIKPEAEKFLSLVPNGGTILDAGCGAGVHSLYFKDSGYQVKAIDLSDKMVEISRKKGIDTELMDLENLNFAKNYFDGIWCHTSLIHLESKNNIVPVLDKFAKILKSRSPLFVALRMGRGEEWENRHNISNSERWFLYFEGGEFERYVPNSFQMIKSGITKYRDYKFVNYLFLLNSKENK